MWRDVFTYSLNPEVFLDGDNLRSLFSTPVDEGRSDSSRESYPTLEEESRAVADLADRAGERWRAFYATVSEAAARDVDRMLVVQTAPMAYACGAWLQGLSAPSVFEDPVHLKALALLADDAGVGQAEFARHDAFRAIARKMGLTSVAGVALDVAAARDIRDKMFRLPGLLYALSRRSDVFAPELVGIDLALRSVGALPPWRILGERHSDPEWRRLDLSRPQTAALGDAETPLSVSRTIAQAFGSDPQGARRVLAGMAKLRELLTEWNDGLDDLAKATADPRLSMALLVQERAREASVYHQDYMLEGRSLSDWFQQAREEPLPLVDALARSRLVRPEAPDKSPLINLLIREDGPMFRVFRTEDIALMRRWIVSLCGKSAGAAACEDADYAGPLPFAVLTRRKRVGQGDTTIGEVPQTIREAYYLLQGRALAPRTRAFADEYCRFWLERAHASIDATDRSLPARWHPGAVRDWLLDAHDKHGYEFVETRGGEAPTREEVIDQTLQLAPLTLIDGAWLQGFTDVSLAATRVGAPLFETYWDELGNGEWSINHPKIYRDVLAAMGISLPPTGSPRFAADQRLHEESFYLPVYWLALGKSPASFRPEILGMNLAMELSGVGGTYRTAREFLKHHGFPTTFVDIHNTIDNVSTGHSAWAADAIDAYMHTVVELGDVDETWTRVRAGYESLSPIVEKSSDLRFFRKEVQLDDSFVRRAGLYHHTPVAA